MGLERALKPEVFIMTETADCELYTIDAATNILLLSQFPDLCALECSRLYHFGVCSR